ncbi:hypothetical protein AN958_08362 [Leucoagaricus sp. SymC.cos]|nr:hypothetical protein AN958_08362 [Leucoagaricus sp. SymC.cos]
MTRTERAAYPRAVNRDRSESRTGLDPSLRKGGAGNHNWGSLADERRLEDTALDDEEYEEADEIEAEAPRVQSPTESSEVSSKPPMERSPSDSSATSNSLTEEDRQKARKLRKNAFKKGDRTHASSIILTSC